MRFRFWGLLLLLLVPSLVTASEPKAEPFLCQEEEERVETHHVVEVEGKQIAYRAVAGTLILKDDNCEPKASLFYVSYVKEGVEEYSERPLTFCFNGGPGSSSVWLHLGAFGPKRVLLDEQGIPLLPYRLVDNAHSLLDLTDLVFIDPVSTGFSYAIPSSSAKEFHGVSQDIKSLGAFIRLYLTRFKRWESPKFIVGESYGTTRAVGLANYLHDQEYIYLNGIVLISAVLNFQSVDFNAGNDLPYLLALPSYTAAAWYHRKLGEGLQFNLLGALKKAREFVVEDYSRALFKGDALTPEEKKRTVRQLARFTGLSQEYIEQSRLRVDVMHFVKQLLRGEARTIGRYDSRFEGIDAQVAGEYFEYDPSGDAVFGAFTSTLNHYLHVDLRWRKEAPYKILTALEPWDYGSPNQYLNLSGDLRGVMAKNPHLRVFVGSGYYDLATPFFATEYTFDHLGLDASLANRVTMTYYDAGHLLYLPRSSLVQLKQDLSTFYRHVPWNVSLLRQSGTS